MKKDYWVQKWQSGDTRFHLEKAHPQLVRHFGLKEKQKVFVPFCGKTKDLLWLRDQGHEVIGCEWSHFACEAFFSENGLEPKLSTQQGFTIYQTKNLQIWNGDFFELPLAVFQDVSAWYDRAALIAIPAETRLRYAQRVKAAFQKANAPNWELLLITAEYEDAKIEGPPFCVMPEEVQRLFGSFLKVEELERSTDPVLSAHPKFQGQKSWEVVYRAWTP